MKIGSVSAVANRLRTTLLDEIVAGPHRVEFEGSDSCATSSILGLDGLGPSDFAPIILPIGTSPVHRPQDIAGNEIRSYQPEVSK